MSTKANLLTFEDGEVRIGDVLLPGILRTQMVSAGIRFDRAERDKMSGKSKTPQGWEDADIKLTLDLICDDAGDCYVKLTAINKLFKSTDKGANPKVYQVTNRHLRARGVTKVIFSGLDSNETDDDDVIQAVLAFSEHIPSVTKKEKQVNASVVPAGAPAVKAKPLADTKIMEDPGSSLFAGFRAGAGR